MRTRHGELRKMHVRADEARHDQARVLDHVGLRKALTQP